jgi:hypothetical protein
MVIKVNQENGIQIFESVGELLKGDLNPIEVDQILLALANNIEVGAGYIANIIEERTEK